MPHRLNYTYNLKINGHDGVEGEGTRTGNRGEATCVILLRGLLCDGYNI